MNHPPKQFSLQKLEGLKSTLQDLFHQLKDSNYSSKDPYDNWFKSAKAVIERVFGIGSVHFDELAELNEQFPGMYKDSLTKHFFDDLFPKLRDNLVRRREKNELKIIEAAIDENDFHSWKKWKESVDRTIRQELTESSDAYSILSKLFTSDSNSQEYHRKASIWFQMYCKKAEAACQKDFEDAFDKYENELYQWLIRLQNEINEYWPEDTTPNISTIKVLFFAANPVDQKQLRLDEEIRNINEKIRLSEYRSSIQLISRWAVRPTDLLQALNEEQPHIVHFSGHGSDTEDIAFMDHDGQSKFVSKVAIVELMKTMSNNIRIVVFNTCFSSNQAEAVTKHIDIAVGISNTINDEGARVFAAQFYSAIGFGESIQAAFDQARIALMLEGILGDDKPQMYAKNGVKPDDLVLVK